MFVKKTVALSDSLTLTIFKNTEKHLEPCISTSIGGSRSSKDFPRRKYDIPVRLRFCLLNRFTLYTNTVIELLMPRMI